MFYQFGQQRNLRGGSTERGPHEVIKGGVNGASGVPQVLLGLLELRQLVATVALVSYSEVRWHCLPGSSQDKVLVAILLCEDSHPGQSYPGQKCTTSLFGKLLGLERKI